MGDRHVAVRRLAMTLGEYPPQLSVKSDFFVKNYRFAFASQ